MITHAAFPKTLLYCFIGPPRTGRFLQVFVSSAFKGTYDKAALRQAEGLLFGAGAAQLRQALRREVVHQVAPGEQILRQKIVPAADADVRQVGPVGQIAAAAPAGVRIQQDHPRLAQSLVIGHCVGYDAVYPLRCHYTGHGIRHGLDVDRGLRPVFEHVVDDDGVVLHDGVLAAVRAHEEKHALKTARRGLHGLGEGQALKSGARRAAVGVLFQGLEGPPVLEVVVDGAVGRGHVARAAEQIHGLQEIVHEVAGERIAHQHGAAVEERYAAEARVLRARGGGTADAQAGGGQQQADESFSFHVDHSRYQVSVPSSNSLRSGM